MNTYLSVHRPSRIAPLLAFCFAPLLLAEIDPAEFKRTKPAATKDVSPSAASPGPLVPLGGPPLIGTYTVGVGGNIASLTNPGGVFDLLNQQGGFGALTFNIISDLTTETGAIALGVVGSATNIVIRPSGAARIISGSNNTHGSSLIRFIDTDNVTIEGSLTAGTALGVGGDPALRNLTIQNTTVGFVVTAAVAASEGTAGAQNFTIRNTIISGQASDQTDYGLFIGGNDIGNSPVTASNNNSRVENCSFQKAATGIASHGRAVSPATGTVITRNDLSATGANQLRRGGIFFLHQNGIQVTANSIGNLAGDYPLDCIGIAAGISSITATTTFSGGISNALIAGNRIHAIVSTQPDGHSAVGIALSGGNPANVIANNMITGVSAQSVSPNLTAGIFIAGGTGSDTRLYYNSVAMTGNRGAAPDQTGSYCVAITGATIPVVDLRDNIFYSTQTSGGGLNARSYVIGTEAPLAALSNLSSDYNTLTMGSNEVTFRVGGLGATGTNLNTFGAWQMSTGEDLHSIPDDPVFVSPLDNLHLTCESQVRNAGIPVAGVPNDYDGQVREVFTPDPGADEFSGPPASVGSLKVHGGSGSIALNLPSATPGIESRSGGVNGNFEIVFSFSLPVTIDGASAPGVGSVSSVTGNGTPEITVNLTGVTNAEYVTVRLDCASDGVLTGDVQTTFGVLVGDTNGNGSVSASDISQTKSRSGQSADPSNFRSDVNVSGTINASDIGQVKSASGSVLP